MKKVMKVVLVIIVLVIVGKVYVAVESVEKNNAIKECGKDNISTYYSNDGEKHYYCTTQK